MSNAVPLLSSASYSTSPTEMIFNGKRGVYTLTNRGIVSSLNNDLLILPFASVVGLSRQGSTLTFFSYPAEDSARASSSFFCCCYGARPAKDARTRVLDSLDCEQEDVAKSWEADVWKHLLPKRGNATAALPRRFLVLINPKSGTGHAEKIFNTHCLPIFTDANIQCTVVKTEAPGHASQYCEENEDIPGFDGIVIVSGDGLLFETLQGLMKRKDWANVIRNVPLGVLPGGSGNGLAHSVAHAAGERRGSTPTSNAFLIAKGVTSPFDLCMVDHASRGRLYSFLSMEYGFACEIDIGSDYMRSLGEVRFTLEALKLLVKPHSTRLRFSYLPVPGNPPSPLEAPKIPSYWESNGYAGEDGPRSLVRAQEEQQEEKWETVEDDFYLMWNSNVTWMSSSAQLSPGSRVNDGYNQVCMYRKRGTRPGNVRWRIAKFLIALDTASHVNLDYLEMFPTRAYTMEPIISDAGKQHKTMIAIDGEEVPLGKISFEVLPGLATIMGLTCDEDLMQMV